LAPSRWYLTALLHCGLPHMTTLRYIHLSLPECNKTLIPRSSDSYIDGQIWRVSDNPHPSTFKQESFLIYSFRYTTAVGKQYTDKSASGKFDLNVFAS
jgi:hypothetical protein